MYHARLSKSKKEESKRNLPRGLEVQKPRLATETLQINQNSRHWTGNRRRRVSNASRAGHYCSEKPQIWSAVAEDDPIAVGSGKAWEDCLEEIKLSGVSIPQDYGAARQERCAHHSWCKRDRSSGEVRQNPTDGGNDYHKLRKMLNDFFKPK